MAYFVSENGIILFNKRCHFAEKLRSLLICPLLCVLFYSALSWISFLLSTLALFLEFIWHIKQIFDILSSDCLFLFVFHFLYFFPFYLYVAKVVTMRILVCITFLIFFPCSFSASGHFSIYAFFNSSYLIVLSVWANKTLI